MQVEALELDRVKARELYQAYKKHQHYAEPIDWEIQRAYQLLAQGRLVIKALESVKAAGLNEKGLPKLAIARATDPECWLTMRENGSATFSLDRWTRHTASRQQTVLPPGTFANSKWVSDRRALVPPCPIHLRPKRGLANYHILWEAEWERVVPRDPYLLRRIGKGDMWLVVAMWDLTEVERAALATRIRP